MASHWPQCQMKLIVHTPSLCVVTARRLYVILFLCNCADCTKLARSNSRQQIHCQTQCTGSYQLCYSINIFSVARWIDGPGLECQKPEHNVHYSKPITQWWCVYWPVDTTVSLTLTLCSTAPTRSGQPQASSVTWGWHISADLHTTMSAGH